MSIEWPNGSDSSKDGDDKENVAQKNQVWRGEATKTLGSGKDPKKVQKNLNKAVAKLLKKYPPPVS